MAFAAMPRPASVRRPSRRDDESAALTNATTAVTNVRMTASLEVEPKRQLHQSPARIEGHVRVLIGAGQLVERRAAVGLRDCREVDGVEQIEDVDADIEAARPAKANRFLMLRSKRVKIGP